MAKILIVDDDVALLARLSSELEAEGYDVMRASEVQNADLLLDYNQFDLVLLDIAASRGEGWELLGRIAPKMPVIVISGRGLEDDIVNSFEAGASDYLPKPFRTAELLVRMRARLQLSAAAKAAASAPAPAETPAEPVAPKETTKPSKPSKPAKAAPAAEAAPKSDEELDAPLSWMPSSSKPAEIPEETAAPARRLLGETEENEPIFISHGEERSIMQSAASERVDMSIEDLEPLPLGKRLHAARQRRRITLVQAELDTKVRMHYIQAMEEEKFALLPHGQFTEEMLRNYSKYLGIDVSNALNEYRRLHYTPPMEPLVALGGRPLPRTIPRWIVSTIAAILALMVGIGAIWIFDPETITTLDDRIWSLIATPEPTPEPTAEPTAEPTPEPTVEPTPEPTATPTPRPTNTPTPSPTADPNATPTIEPTGAVTPTP